MYSWCLMVMWKIFLSVKVKCLMLLCVKVVELFMIVFLDVVVFDVWFEVNYVILFGLWL